MNRISVFFQIKQFFAPRGERRKISADSAGADVDLRNVFSFSKFEARPCPDSAHIGLPVNPRNSTAVWGFGLAERRYARYKQNDERQHE